MRVFDLAFRFVVLPIVGSAAFVWLCVQARRAWDEIVSGGGLTW